MTFIAGFISQGTIYFLGDSAVTIEGKIYKDEEIHKRSVFGEAIINEDNIQIIDSALKIIKITDQLVVAGAGDVVKCQDFIQDLRLRIKSMRKSESVTDMIKTLLLDYGNPKDVSFIFGIIDPKAELLVAYNCQEEGDITYAGNLSQPYVTLIMNHFSAFDKVFKGQTHKYSAFLICLTSFAQSVLMRNYQLPNGVGGLVSGLYLNQSGMGWSDDCCYILYHVVPNTAEVTATALIKIAFRGNGVFVQSPESTHLLMNSDDSNDTSVQWRSKFESEIRRKFDSCDFEYYVFLDTIKAKTTVVTNDRNKSCSFFSMTQKESLLTLKLSTELKQLLLEDTSDNSNYGEPVHLGSVEDCYNWKFNWA